jgi:predicted transcriptional regulator
MKLFDSERKVMEVLWSQGDMQAKQVAALLHNTEGWNKNTTYTVLKKLVEKEAIERSEPGFVCHAKIDKNMARKAALAEVLEKFCMNSKKVLFASLLEQEPLTEEEIAELHRMIDEMK